MSASALSQIHGALSAAIGFGFAWATWNYGIRTASANRWMAGLQFTLWGAIPGLFYLGGPVSRLILGLGAPLYGGSFAERVQGSIGLWILGSFVLFPVGVARASRTRSSSMERSSRASVSSRDRVRSWRWFNHVGLWAFTAAVVIFAGMLAEEFEHELYWAWPAAITLMILAQLRALFWTYKWLSEVRPHVRWHWAKLAIVWGASVGGVRVGYVQMDYEWLPVLVLGGALALALCLALTWTWLSAREGQTDKVS